MKFNLGWGNSVAVRQAFLETYDGNMVVFSAHGLARFDYPAHEGDPELIEITDRIIQRQTGKHYKHILLTNGATGGVVISLRAFEQKGFKYCHTRNPPYYIRYPRMIRAAGLMRVNEDFPLMHDQGVILLDMPSNPLGLCGDYPQVDDGNPVILDGVYYNNVYAPRRLYAPDHDILVGSYSKLLGLNGLRVGWIATNDDDLALRLADLVTSEYCGLDTATTEIIKTTLFNFSWDSFERLARTRLDYNREQFSKLEKFFGDTPVLDLGMFAYMPVDTACKKLLEKSGIHYCKGSEMGTNDNFARFNLGQSCEMIAEAVQTMLKNDQI